MIDPKTIIRQFRTDMFEKANSMDCLPGIFALKDGSAERQKWFDANRAVRVGRRLWKS